MIEALLFVLIILGIGTVLILVLRKGRGEGSQKELAAILQNQDRLENTLRQELSKNREEASSGLKLTREELSARITDIARLQGDQLSRMAQTNEQKLEKMRETIEAKLKSIQEDNTKKLEQMRATVDEKLHATLEKRLGESFKIVSERLELVHKGLGEMQSLATGVGDLKKVLTNVKTRGIWGEVQLENLLEQILTKEQYEKNVITKHEGNDRVEFAIKLPGQGKGIVWLPIDAKFPQEDYQRLVDAYEKGGIEQIEEASKQLEIRITGEAKDIKEKYIDPPYTTDIGIMFLPYESLYAEAIRRPGLMEKVQRIYRVNITGPSTLAAFLNSLHMGFRTLAIERHTSEIWTLLGAVKTEFTKFGDILDKTHKKLQEASNTIEDATKKSRTIESKLKKVQELHGGEHPQDLIESATSATTELDAQDK